MRLGAKDLADRQAGRSVFSDERGATAVEYGILLAAIAGVIMAVVFSVGGYVLNDFESFQAGLGAALGD